MLSSQHARAQQRHGGWWGCCSASPPPPPHASFQQPLRGISLPLLPLLLIGLVSAPLHPCSAASTAQQQCAVGDGACFCAAVRGTWLATPTTLRPLCRKTVDHGGRRRIVDVYFSADIGKPGVSFTPWFHLHGVQLAQWWLDKHPEYQQQGWAAPLGGNADASRSNALTGSPITSSSGAPPDRTSGAVKQPGTILVVPQGTGDVNSGQMWNALFWPCMGQGRCVDGSVDDVGFLSSLLRDPAALLPGLPLKATAVLSGYSNGGMMAQALLCKQPDLASRLSGLALLGTMLGSAWAATACTRPLPAALPIVWLHGVQDPVLPFGPGGSSMGVAALGAEAATRLWAARSGCADVAAGKGPGPAQRTLFADSAAGVECVNVCGSSSSSASAPPVVLCAVSGGGHGVWDAPPGTGFTAGIAQWAFASFQGQPRPL